MHPRTKDYQLLVAAAQGDTHTVTSLLKEHANINGTDASGKTALSRASYKGHSKTAQALIEHGATKDTQDTQGATPLFHAIRKRHTGLAELLLEAQASADITKNDGNSPIHKAASKGLLEMIALLRKRQASVSAQNNHGNRPLHTAARKGHAPVIERLMLIDGADPMAQNNKGQTALHYAASKRRMSACKVLIQSFIILQIRKRAQEALPRIITAQLSLKKSPLLKDLYAFIFSCDKDLRLDILCCSIALRHSNQSLNGIEQALRAPCPLMKALSLEETEVAQLLAALTYEQLMNFCMMTDKKGRTAYDLTTSHTLKAMLNEIITIKTLEAFILGWITEHKECHISLNRSR